jgi:tRNA U34 5-carboxymethylaminomethyl modifying GTPase MnmE/TrmE
MLEGGTLDEPRVPHTLPRARLIDSASGGTIDDVLCAVMRAPVSYTIENVVEISCHRTSVVLVINKTGPTLHPTTVGIDGVRLPALT